MAGKLLNGWMASGILSLRTGFPIEPRLGSNRSRSKSLSGSFGGTTDRPDLVAGRTNDDITQGTSTGCLGVPIGTKLGGPERYFDPCAYTIPAAGFLGTAARNSLVGPGLANLDLSLVKETALGFLGEAGKLEFRAEFFNILNRVNFGNPNATIFAGSSTTQLGPYVEAPASSGATITGTRGTSRQIQFALKLAW